MWIQCDQPAQRGEEVRKKLNEKLPIMSSRVACQDISITSPTATATALGQLSTIFPSLLTSFLLGCSRELIVVNVKKTLLVASTLLHCRNRRCSSLTPPKNTKNKKLKHEEAGETHREKLQRHQDRLYYSVLFTKCDQNESEMRTIAERSKRRRSLVTWHSGQQWRTRRAR